MPELFGIGSSKEYFVPSSAIVKSVCSGNVALVVLRRGAKARLGRDFKIR